MCLRIWSTGPDMRVSIARRSDDSRSAPEFSCTFWIECRSIQWPRHSWKRQVEFRQWPVNQYRCNWIYWQVFIWSTMGAHACGRCIITTNVKQRKQSSVCRYDERNKAVVQTHSIYIQTAKVSALQTNTERKREDIVKWVIASKPKLP